MDITTRTIEMINLYNFPSEFRTFVSVFLETRVIFNKAYKQKLCVLYRIINFFLKFHVYFNRR